MSTLISFCLVIENRISVIPSRRKSTLSTTILIYYYSNPEDTKHVLFLGHKAREVWRRLGLNKIIMRACEIDRAGEPVLEFLLLMPEQDLTSVATMNVREMIAITTWHL